MFRRTTTGILSHSRFFSTAEDELFVAAWKRTVPNLDPPKTPLSFLHHRPSVAAASIPSKLTINLISPYSSRFSTKQVDMVVVPATTGQMGIVPGHLPLISELKPGLLSLHEENEVTKYFISSGFVFVHSNSITDIMATEFVPIEHVDPVSVQKGLVEFTQKLSHASTDLERAEAHIGLEVLSALNSSISG